jgi:hypothetical protein
LDRTYNGPYSDADTTNLTEDLKSDIGYYAYKEHGNALFWIDFDSALEYFEYADINWNPTKFVARDYLWNKWLVKDMVDDEYNLSENPQISVEFLLGPTDLSQEISLWVLLLKLPRKDEKATQNGFMGISAFLNTNYGQVIYNTNSFNELSLTSEHIKLYKFTFPRELIESKRFVNLVLRQFWRNSDMNYSYFHYLYANIEFSCCQPHISKRSKLKSSYHGYHNLSPLKYLRVLAAIIDSANFSIRILST